MMTPRRLGVVAIAAVMALAIMAPRPATADDARAIAERAFRTGERLFNAGEFTDAAASFEAALKTMPVPAIGFSTAQAHRLAWVKGGDPSHLRRAVELFRKYVVDVGSGQRVSDATAALGELDPELRRLEQSGASFTAPTARTTALLVTSQIEGATGAIDRDAKLTGTLPLVRDVPPGPHTVVVEAPGYFPKSVNVTAVDGERLPVEVVLEPQPARLVIRGEAGATITVDGRPVGTLPLAAPIEVASGRHLVSVTRRGRVGVAREVEVARGEERDVTTPMRSTGQRRAVKWVMIGGGVLALGAGLAGLDAWRVDGDAAAIRDRANAGGIDAATAARYDELRADRDRGRQIMWGLAGASVVTVAAATLLYFFDHDRAEAPVSAAMDVRPVVSVGGAGLVVAGRF